jgi:hypothetical protein
MIVCPWPALSHRLFIPAALIMTVPATYTDPAHEREWEGRAAFHAYPRPAGDEV